MYAALLNACTNSNVEEFRVILMDYEQKENGIRKECRDKQDLNCLM